MLDTLDWNNSTARRFGLTVVAALLYVAGAWVPVPQATLPEAAYFGLPKWPLSVATLGVLPFMVGFVVAEVAGIALVGDRELARGSDRPRWIHRTAIWSGLVFSVIGAALAYQYWFGLVPARLAGGAMSSAAHGWGESFVVVATLVAGAALYYAAADAVTRFGLGNGFAVLLGAGMLVEGYWAYRDFGGWLTSMSFQNLDVFAVLGNILGVAAVILATLWMLFRLDGWVAGRGPRSPWEERNGDGQWYDVPPAGLVPFVAVKLVLIAGGTYGFVREMADPAALLQPAMRVWTVSGTWTYLALALAMAVPATVACSVIFYRDGWSLSEWLSGGGDTRRFRRAVAATVGYVALLLFADLFGGQLVRSLGVVTVALGTGIACDVLGAWRFRRVHEEAVTLEILHRNRAVGRIVGRLEDRGIEAHASGRCFRGLLQVFGAFAPIQVLVPADQVDRAREVVAEGRE